MLIVLESDDDLVRERLLVRIVESRREATGEVSVHI
jgi:hypothetical protein